MSRIAILGGNFSGHHLFFASTRGQCTRLGVRDAEFDYSRTKPSVVEFHHPIHNSHKASQAQYLREGGSTLFPEEVELLGDITGKNLVHLQCNCGQDSLSLVQLGAAVTGVDISDEAISFARQLSKESGLAAHFIRSDVYDWATTGRAGRGALRYRVFILRRYLLAL